MSEEEFGTQGPTSTIVGLDFETYSDVDLRRHGLVRYLSSPNFKVLLAAIAWIDDSNTHISMILDFTEDHDAAADMLGSLLAGRTVVAHNAAFERGVLDTLHIHKHALEFIDSAVFARVAGLGSSLEAAAPQALGVDKLESGKAGIQLFSIPGTYQMDNGDMAFDPKVVADHPKEWDEFKTYCGMDASLSLRLAYCLQPAVSKNELHYSTCTMLMNDEGWHVDLPLVEEMQRRYLANQEELVLRFRLEVEGTEDLNLNSNPQLIKWCGERGIRAKSFDEQHVASMKAKLEQKLEGLEFDDHKRAGYEEVLRLLQVKQALGGSSLKKLRTILDTATPDGMLFDQYLHAGAGTSLRTTGRSVQMQNLKRLGKDHDDVTELFDPGVHWDNGRLGRNLRQVFTSKHEDGRLVVGDFSAVESRGLAWLAGEDWKLDAYRNGIGVYEKQAAEFYGIRIEDVQPEQRMFSKVGELSCGYEAGAEAVQEFAEKMGVPLSLGEAKKLVSDFRTTNQETVKFWRALQDALLQVSEIGLSTVAIPQGTITMETIDPIPSLKRQTSKKVKTLMVQLEVPQEDDPFTMLRVFHGFHPVARGFQFWKPSARKTGDLWTPDYTDPKTGRRKPYSLYGGKLAGILTQSLCREIFMQSMSRMTLWADRTKNVGVVGQMHDELVLDWTPEKAVLDPSLDETVTALEKVMSHTGLPGFPLACAVKTDFRYTK